MAKTKKWSLVFHVLQRWEAVQVLLGRMLAAFFQVWWTVSSSPHTHRREAFLLPRLPQPLCAQRPPDQTHAPSSDEQNAGVGGAPPSEQHQCCVSPAAAGSENRELTRDRHVNRELTRDRHVNRELTRDSFYSLYIYIPLLQSLEPIGFIYVFEIRFFCSVRLHLFH